MKFAHIADMHFDTAFDSLENSKGLGEKRRLEQRDVFRKMIEQIKNREIKFLFISGDLYEQKSIRQTTIDYINSLFREIPDTRIFITPGNHDPFITNSFYAKYKWAENVYIFSDKVEKIETPEADIYGVGYASFYTGSLGIENTNIENKDKINIAVVHATIDGTEKADLEYNPVSSKKIIEAGFDYIACGHVHKREYIAGNKIVYPGSMISLGFDEPGEHGMIIGDVSKESVQIEFIKLDDRIFKVEDEDISEINSEEELIEKINSLEFDKNEEIEINLVGRRNFEINKNNILKLIQNDKVLKIKDSTKIKYNIEEIAKEDNLRGIFVRKLLAKKEDGTYTEEEILKAIEIGLEAL